MTLLGGHSPTLLERMIGELADRLEPPPEPDQDYLSERLRLEADPQTWLRALFPGYLRSKLDGSDVPFGAHHVELLEWAWAIQMGIRPRPFVAMWPRGGAKSTITELVTVGLGATRRRRYGLYCCNTQDQADGHVTNIGTMLESSGIDKYYPDMGTRKVGKHGTARAWRRSRLWTAHGFVIDAIGLETAARGLKVETDRPDFLILDDVDAKHDGEAMVKKKLETITSTLIPAGSNDLAILGVQNLVHKGSVFDKIARREVDFIQDRITSGPLPAIKDMRYEQYVTTEGIKVKITGGRPIWEGQGIRVCEDLINSEGLRSFRVERQHEVDLIRDGLWKQVTIDAYRAASMPPTLKRIVVAVDPPASSGEHAAEAGIVVAGLDERGHAYVLADRSIRGTPSQWGAQAVAAYSGHHADRIIAEANNGGEMVGQVIQNAAGRNLTIPIKLIHASRGKQTRAEPVEVLYSLGRVHHVGTFPELEGQMVTWTPGEDSPDRLDALVWAITELLIGGGVSVRAL